MVDVDPTNVISLLDDEFGEAGVIGGRWFSEVLDREQEHSQATLTGYRGHRVVMDCFWDLFTESLRRAVDVLRLEGWPATKPNYFAFLLIAVVLFRKTRAADKLSTS